MSEKKTYHVTAAISGVAYVTVESDSEESALEASKFSEWKIEDWDLNTEEYRGGFIHAQED